jgi:hypothetical protein
VLFLTRNISFCRWTGTFNCPSTEYSSETIYIYIYMQKLSYV